jgi:hypothetical protein
MVPAHLLEHSRGNVEVWTGCIVALDPISRDGISRQSKLVQGSPRTGSAPIPQANLPFGWHLRELGEEVFSFQ